MRKKDLIATVARQAGLTVAQVTAVYDANEEVITAALREDGRAIVPGVVRLSTKVVPSRAAFNAMLGRETVYAGGIKVVAKVAKELQEGVR